MNRTIVVRDGFCQGALITSDDLDDCPADFLNGGAATLLDGPGAGMISRISRSRPGVILLSFTFPVVKRGYRVAIDMIGWE